MVYVFHLKIKIEHYTVKKKCIAVGKRFGKVGCYNLQWWAHGKLNKNCIVLWHAHLIAIQFGDKVWMKQPLHSKCLANKVFVYIFFFLIFFFSFFIFGSNFSLCKDANNNNWIFFLLIFSDKYYSCFVYFGKYNFFVSKEDRLILPLNFTLSLWRKKKWNKMLQHENNWKKERKNKQNKKKQKN